MEPQTLTTRKIFWRSIFWLWLPLAATWLLMSVEHPVLQGVIARLDQAKLNLAAYGVSFSVYLIIVSPLVPLFSASTALVADKDSYRRLRNLALALSLLMSGLLATLIYSPVSHLLFRQVLELPEDVASLARMVIAVLIPTPFFLGYRRLYQGILVRFGQNARVALGTTVRLLVLAATALMLAAGSSLPGAVIAALALSAGYGAETLAIRGLAHGAVQQALKREITSSEKELSYLDIISFFLPLGLTSIIGMAGHPLLVFFVSHGNQPVESLAVFSVLGSLGFLLTCPIYAMQEIIISMIGAQHQNSRVLSRFLALVASVIFVLMLLLFFTPLINLLLSSAYGLSAELIQFAVAPARLLIPLPLLFVVLVWQRGVLIQAKRTLPLTMMSLIHLLFLGASMMLLMEFSPWSGVTCALLARIVGRTTEMLGLWPSYSKVSKH